MSRIGSRPVALPSGVTIQVAGTTIAVKGPKGELKMPLLSDVDVMVDGSTVTVKRQADTAQARACHGLIRQLIASMAKGVAEGYEKGLEIIGVGYKAQVKPLDAAGGKGKTLLLNLGHSHPISFPIPADIEIGQDEKNKNILFVRGIDKQRVGQVAAQIRELRPPEPYKGKGIRYLSEQVRRKPGKAAVAKAAA